MALSVRELREQLEKWADQDQLIAYSIWTKEDVESLAVEAVGEPDPKDVWGKVVDGLQNELNEGWLIEKISESLTEEFYRYYEIA